MMCECAIAYLHLHVDESLSRGFGGSKHKSEALIGLETFQFYVIGEK